MTITVPTYKLPTVLPDSGQDFPEEAIALLQELGLMTVTLPSEYGGELLGIQGGYVELLNILAVVGSCNLSVGRIYEGHINALLLIHTYGNEQQKKRFYGDAAQGKLFGVWNTERSFEKLKLEDHKGGFVLNGAKIFCSGALHVQRPIVTVDGPGGRSMMVLDLDNAEKGMEDWSLWNPMGMEASVSCRIDFSGMKVAYDQLLGKADDYEREPVFSGGAIRFAAVQMGGSEALANTVLTHLKKHKRTSDPHQQLRLGKLVTLVESGKLWLTAAGQMADECDNKNPDIMVNYANMMRTAIQEICEDIIHICEKSIGLQGFMKYHPMEQRYRDLNVYLKQPGPDRAVTSIAKFISKRNHTNDVK